MKILLIRIIFSTIIGLVGLYYPINTMINNTLVIVAYLIVGWDVLLHALKNIIKGRVFDENFLMSIATIGAFVINEQFEAIVVMLFYQIGEAFQHHAVSKSRESITSLMEIKPEYAILIKDDKEVKVSPKDVLIGDIVICKAGDKIPLDGIIIEGTSSLDTKALTGESIPKDVGINDEVLSGCININGVIKIRITKLEKDSTVSKILELVENASIRKSKSEKFITKFARYYTPIVVVLAVLLAIVPPLLNMGTFYDWFYRALSFLVVSCPCALVISIPLGFFGGIGGAARCGILVKGSNYLEALAKSKIMVFDKTGTLTKGVFKVDKIMPHTITKEELMYFAANAESYSNHPIAKSIVDSYDLELSPEIFNNVKEKAGHGIIANYQNELFFAGNKKLMELAGIVINEEESYGSVIYLALGAKYLGSIIIIDEVKEEAYNLVSDLKQVHINKIYMLTGDKKENALKLKEELNIDEVYYELLPTDKVTSIEKILKQKQAKTTVAYIGDGINDAPVLKRADIGIAMGAMGSDAAIEACDVVIMTDDLSLIVTAKKIAEKTMNIVKQNIALAFIIKIIVLVLSTLGMSTLLEAIFADVGVAILAILNATRALKYNK